MKPTRGMLAFLGLVALAVIALIVREVRAADKDDIAKIADSLKAGNAAAANAAAVAYAAKHKVAGLGGLMDGFNKKELIADGIERKINGFTKAPPTPVDFVNADYKEIGATAAAIGLVCDAFPAPKVKNGSQAQWTAFSKDLRDKGMKFQAAFASKKGADTKTAAIALAESCTKCHIIYRP